MSWVLTALLQTGETRRVFRGHKGPVTSVALAESSTRLLLFTGSWDKTVRVWDAEVGSPLSAPRWFNP
jgi:WD40 repeat protein